VGKTRPYFIPKLSSLRYREVLRFLHASSLPYLLSGRVVFGDGLQLLRLRANIFAPIAARPCKPNVVGVAGLPRDGVAPGAIDAARQEIPCREPRQRVAESFHAAGAEQAIVSA